MELSVIFITGCKANREGLFCNGTRKKQVITLSALCCYLADQALIKGWIARWNGFESFWAASFYVCARLGEKLALLSIASEWLSSTCHFFTFGPPVLLLPRLGSSLELLCGGICSRSLFGIFDLCRRFIQSRVLGLFGQWVLVPSYHHWAIRFDQLPPLYTSATRHFLQQTFAAVELRTPDAQHVIIGFSLLILDRLPLSDCSGIFFCF